MNCIKLEKRTYFCREENFNLEFSSPPGGEENYNLEFSSGELMIEVHLFTIYIQELRILGPNIERRTLASEVYSNSEQVLVLV